MRPPTNRIDVAVGARMKARRLQLGLGLETLADLLGVSRAQLEKLEAGTDRIGAALLARAAKALNVNVTYFFPVQSEPLADVLDDVLVADIMTLGIGCSCSSAIRAHARPSSTWQPCSPLPVARSRIDPALIGNCAVHQKPERGMHFCSGGAAGCGGGGRLRRRRVRDAFAVLTRGRPRRAARRLRNGLRAGVSRRLHRRPLYHSVVNGLRAGARRRGRRLRRRRLLHGERPFRGRRHLRGRRLWRWERLLRRRRLRCWRGRRPVRFGRQRDHDRAPGAFAGADSSSGGAAGGTVAWGSARFGGGGASSAGTGDASNSPRGNCLSRGEIGDRRQFRQFQRGGERLDRLRGRRLDRLRGRRLDRLRGRRLVCRRGLGRGRDARQFRHPDDRGDGGQGGGHESEGPRADHAARKPWRAMRRESAVRPSVRISPPCQHPPRADMVRRARAAKRSGGSRFGCAKKPGGAGSVGAAAVGQGHFRAMLQSVVDHDDGVARAPDFKGGGLLARRAGNGQDWWTGRPSARTPRGTDGLPRRA